MIRNIILRSCTGHCEEQKEAYCCGRVAIFVPAFSGVDDTARLETSGRYLVLLSRGNDEKSELRDAVVTPVDGPDESMGTPFQLRAYYVVVDGTIGAIPITDKTGLRVGCSSEELGGMIAEFDALTKKELPTVNAALQNKKLDTITLFTKAGWEKKQEKDRSAAVPRGPRAA